MDVRERAWTGNKFQLFRAEIERYTRDRLGGMSTRRCQPDSEKITLTLDFRRRLNCENSPRIAENRADLLRFVHQAAKTMGVMYSSTPSKRSIIHVGENEERSKKFNEEEQVTTNTNSTTTDGQTFSFDEFM